MSDLNTRIADLENRVVELEKKLTSIIDNVSKRVDDTRDASQIPDICTSTDILEKMARRRLELEKKGSVDLTNDMRREKIKSSVKNTNV